MLCVEDERPVATKAPEVRADREWQRRGDVAGYVRGVMWMVKGMVKGMVIGR